MKTLQLVLGFSLLSLVSSTALAGRPHKALPHKVAHKSAHKKTAHKGRKQAPKTRRVKHATRASERELLTPKFLKG
jgi:hypothetical protein